MVRGAIRPARLLHLPGGAFAFLRKDSAAAQGKALRGSAV